MLQPACPALSFITFKLESEEGINNTFSEKQWGNVLLEMWVKTPKLLNSDSNKSSPTILIISKTRTMHFKVIVAEWVKKISGKHRLIQLIHFCETLDTDFNGSRKKTIPKFCPYVQTLWKTCQYQTLHWFYLCRLMHLGETRPWFHPLLISTS